MVPSDTLQFRLARPSEISLIVSLLDENRLPSVDISAKLHCITVATSHDLLVGIGGLEVHGTLGLLRSVATTERFRGKGFGKVIVEYLMTDAKERGVTAVYLLTLTAEDFFAKLGFTRIDRTTVPDAIRATTEFDSLCPATAVCMMKAIEAEHTGSPLDTENRNDTDRGE